MIGSISGETKGLTRFMAPMPEAMFWIVCRYDYATPCYH